METIIYNALEMGILSVGFYMAARFVEALITTKTRNSALVLAPASSSRVSLSTIRLAGLSAVMALVLWGAGCNKREAEDLSNLAIQRTDASQALVLNLAEVNSDITLSDRVNGVDYIVKSEIQVNVGNLEIKPGVTIQFETAAGIRVNEGGSLTAIGEKGNEIYFSSRTGKRAEWNGITILSNSSSNIISYCHIEHGGNEANSFGQADLIIGSTSAPALAEISNNTIMASGSAGVIINQGSSVRSFNTNTISSNSGFPVSIHIADAQNLLMGNVYRNNGKEFIELTGSGNKTIMSACVLSNLSEPFFLSGQIFLGSNLLVNPSTRIYLSSGSRLTLDGKNGNGSLTAIGSASQPIMFIGQFAKSGIWNAINFNSSNSALNMLEYCHFTDGGGENTQSNYGMINFFSQTRNANKVSIKNCFIGNSASAGIYIQSGTVYNADIETANTFSNNIGPNVFYDIQ